MAKQERNNHIVLKIIACVLVFIISAIGGFVFSFMRSFIDKDESNVAIGELSMHFMYLGNKDNGDSIYIKAGDTDILVDAGSAADSLDTIKTYVNQYCTDGVLEYVIVTHADLDHIAAFAGTTKANTSIFDFYKCETIIDFARTDKTTATYNRYVEKRDNEVEKDGAVHYTALQCYKNQDGAKREYELSPGITMEFLYHDYYEIDHEDENNYSVCFMLKHGDKNFLFTGDLEEDGEASLVNKNSLPEVDLYKAGHHGSKTSSNDILLDVIKPKISVVCCSAGNVQYLTQGVQNLHNTFPTQAYIDRISKHTDKVFVTTYAEIAMVDGRWKNTGEHGLLNGNIVVTSKAGNVTVNCSNNNTILKDTQWFKDNRDMPSAWAN
ncbi:MAG: MBL fold metallo-hydrolase [Clostridiales bacterium]|nr:MBL fold metallo-hydrolase [Clostridiales bacterium]